MVANVGIFKVADAPTNRYIYSIPLKDTWVMERFWKYDKFYFFVPVAQAPVRGAHPIIKKIECNKLMRMDFPNHDLAIADARWAVHDCWLQ